MLDINLAYLAGAIDADGYFTIRKRLVTTQELKQVAVFSLIMGLKQISDTVPILLKKTFGGHIVHIKARKRKKALWTWQTTHRAAYNAARQLIFYLQIKRQQAYLFLEFQKTKESKYQKFAFWYEHKHPNWRNEKMVSIQEARKILSEIGYPTKKTIR